MISNKIPPHNLEAEQAILGALILFPKSLPKIRDLLGPDDFYRENHSLIYDAILSLKDFDYLLLHNELKKREELERIGGGEYLSGLSQAVTTGAGIVRYAEILKELSHKRQVITLCQNVAENAFSLASESDSILSTLKSGVREIETDQPTQYTPNHEILRQRIDVIEARQNGEQPGYMTGIEKLDDRLYGLWPSCTYVLKAKSQSGKSSLSLNIADNVAQTYPDKDVLYFILESSKEYVSDRRLSRATQIPLTRLQLGKLHDDYEWEKLIKSCDTLPSNIILLDDPKFYTFEKFTACVESFVLERDISFVVLDYLQLMESAKTFKNRHLELSHIATGMNWLAKSIKAPVLYLSQINKDGETKESGDIFNAADVVLKLERETDEEEAKLTGEKGRDVAVPFYVNLWFKKNTQTWSG